MTLDAEIRYLTPDEVVVYHATVLGAADAAPRDSVRDWNLLLSALNRPRTAAYYEEADLLRQAATLLWGLVENHPFHDGNKRTAWVAAEAFLQANRRQVTATDDEVFTIVVSIAQGLALDEAETWLREHVVAMP